MTPESTTSIFPESSSREQALEKATERARQFLYGLQYPDGHWCAELESNTTITSQYVFLHHVMGEKVDPSYREQLSERRDAIQFHLLSNQKEDGSWGLATNFEGDVSTTTETYLALRILGLPVEHEGMRKAENFILQRGGIEKVKVFTRIQLAQFGLFPWEAVPALLPELMLIPKRFPINIYSVSSWARGTIVPMMVLFHHRPVFELPNGRSNKNDWLDHLWLDAAHKKIPYGPSILKAVREGGVGWRTIFTLADRVANIYDLVRPDIIRSQAMRRAVDWLKDRIEESGDIAGIWPPMYYGMLSLLLTGHSADEPPVSKILEAIERFILEDERGCRVQACVSPVWDTALAMTALLQAERGDTVSEGGDSNGRLEASRQWLRSKQILVDYGDWKVFNRKGTPGGWSFEYANTWYPDVDDTAAVIIAKLLLDPKLRDDGDLRRSVEWILSMQNPDGGWAAFDVRNDKQFLNEIPFSDMDSLSDPSSPDVTGRVLKSLAMFACPEHERAIARGVRYLHKNQEPEGAWYGRWGVNYVYGTSLALDGLAACGATAEDATVRSALDWLASAQNEDGGWGEGLESYRDRNHMGVGKTTPSQTAWGILGLLAFLPVENEAVQRGVTWLLQNQLPNGTWHEEEFTGTGFPNHFYIRYHLYRHNFPLMALGRYREVAGA